ncbi:hypothetical protein PIB30_065310 [Stylosanthes scabra]|uniref:Uncharacterized protein n=1 Tax=Stylosanthes scabra TaxID=79078 RepID=A0ABU6WLW9_9FABA|nr:hypothetical protein [Stylosanthes scabra]
MGLATKFIQLFNRQQILLQAFHMSYPLNRAPPSLSAPSQTELVAVAPTAAPSHRRHFSPAPPLKSRCRLPLPLSPDVVPQPEAPSCHLQICRVVSFLSSPPLPTQGIHPSIRGEV